MRLLIVDDHELARVGLRGILAGAPGIEVAGEAASGREAVEQCLALRPDLVLMDVRMPEMDGLAATAAVKRACPETRVLIVTMHEVPGYLRAALRAGAAGLILKDLKRSELIAAVRRAVRGESVLPPDARAEGAAAAPEPSAHLTARELEVLGHLAQGRTNREIAAILVVTPGTVKVHVEHIIAKLEVADRTQAVVRGIELGLIEARAS